MAGSNCLLRVPNSPCYHYTNFRIGALSENRTPISSSVARRPIHWTKKAWCLERESNSCYPVRSGRCYPLHYRSAQKDHLRLEGRGRGWKPDIIGKENWLRRWDSNPCVRLMRPPSEPLDYRAAESHGTEPMSRSTEIFSSHSMLAKLLQRLQRVEHP